MYLEKKKKFIIVSGPIASGKTTLAVNIALNVPQGCFYMDKDSLVPVSNLVTSDRKSKVFKEKVRDPEYDAMEKIALENLFFNDFVIINAPYTGELLEEESRGSARLSALHGKVENAGGELIVIYIKTDAETRRQHFEKRALMDPDAHERDRLMSDHYKNGETDRLSVPVIEKRTKNIDLFTVFDGSREGAFESLLDELGIALKKNFEPDIMKRFH